MLGGDLEGLSLQSQKDFSRLLNDLPLEELDLFFDAGLTTPALLAMLRNEVRNHLFNPVKIRGRFSYDPFVYIMEHGRYPKRTKRLKEDIKQIVHFSTECLPKVRPLAVDGRFYHNSGATIVQELGYALASASEYLTILTDAGFALDKVASTIHFNLSVGSAYFLEIAKFRAARLLWKNLIEAFDGNPKRNKMYLHAETSRWNKTLYDPYTNMLRTTTEGMSASIAGCDSMTVLPFDEHFRKPDEFSCRIARNQQLIMGEEAYLDKVVDPAAGSYYVEKLTEMIGERAWGLFQEIEQQGGLFRAIDEGTPQMAIKNVQQKRDLSVATRKRVFVGTNQFTNDEDRLAEKISTDHTVRSLKQTNYRLDTGPYNFVEILSTALKANATLGDIISLLFNKGKHYIRTVNPYRGTQAFEKLRLATERHETTPTVLTLPIGHKKWRKARSTFASNFFGCIGYHIENPIGFEDMDEALEAIKEQSPEVVVLCSSDDEYPELVPTLGEALDTMEEPPIFVLAGYPEQFISHFKSAGVEEFIHTKSNVLKTLKRFQNKLEIIEDN
jgi:methylmalonyl-CoA mutase